LVKQSNKEFIQKGQSWFKNQGWSPFPFQEQAWEAHLNGLNGLVNAPTGSGKTYSLIMPILLEFIRDSKDFSKENNGLQAIWITPIRALTKDIQAAAQRAADDLGLNWKVGIRSSDTSQSERAKQKRKAPEILITTPESLHLLLAAKHYPKYFKNLKTIVIDEWHELIGTKRGVQIELALSRLNGMLPALKTWGISATIGNMQEAIDVLLGDGNDAPYKVIRSGIKKAIEVETILPDEVETFPWAGHLGIKLLEKVIPIINSSQSTLIFTNTRSQCEMVPKSIGS
jgi:ATP-dependent Lhr-like helicase